MFDYKRVFGTREEEDRYRANYDAIDWNDSKKDEDIGLAGKRKGESDSLPK
ncbi:MAG: hypothetical protein V3R78_10100 [Thermodesulfobacteriota bacterium]